MKILTFIFDLFRLLFISFYVRFKNLNAKSRFLTIIAYVFILNMIINFYFIDLVLNLYINVRNDIIKWGYIRLSILIFTTLLVTYLDYKYKNDKKFTVKYRNVITHNLFEYIIFILFITFVIIYIISKKNLFV